MQKFLFFRPKTFFNFERVRVPKIAVLEAENGGLGTGVFRKNRGGGVVRWYWKKGTGLLGAFAYVCPSQNETVQ
jgi:hypothetical protein